VYVLQYSIVNPEKLPDGDENFMWVMKYHNNGDTYNKLAGAGKIRNMIRMEENFEDGPMLMSARTILAVAMGTGSEDVYNQVMNNYEEPTDIMSTEECLAIMGIAIANGHTNIVYMLMSDYDDAAVGCVRILVQMKNYNMIGVLWRGRPHYSGLILDMILQQHNDYHLFKCKPMAKACGISIKALNKRLAKKFAERGELTGPKDGYWIATYKLLDRPP